MTTHALRGWPMRAFLLVVALLVGLALALSAPPSHAQASSRSAGYWALKWAESHELGAWYCWGGTGGCYDCSGAVMTAFEKAVHIYFGRTTYEMLASGRIYQVAASQRRPGDLAFWGDFHVEFVTHHGTFGAQQTGTQVGWHRLWGSPTYWRIR